MTGFFGALEERVNSTGSILCVGLDPRVGSPGEARTSCLALIAATAASAAAFKPNAAFFEAFGPDGIEALIEVVAAVPGEIPVILDVKRGDIGSSAEAYARACFDVVGAGSVTVSPYLGREAIEPFLAHPGRGVWVLCRTSNPGSAEIQEAGAAGGGSFAERVAATATAWAPPDRLGLVVAATDPAAMGRVRAIAPAHWFLAPGVGVQGADPEAIAAGLRADGSGVLVPVSRAIAGATDPGGAAADLRSRLRRVRPARSKAPSLAGVLHASGCVRFGEFTLRSGVVSPVYVDVRRLAGHPGVMRRVAGEYGRLLRGIAFDHVGAVPYGAIGIGTAVALEAGASLVWPRPEPKGHGTGAVVEGVWSAGERVALIDDVATTGTSAIEAAAILRRAGLTVEDLVVLVERDPSARPTLAEAGIRLHAITTLAGLVADLVASGVASAEQGAAVEEFLGA
ncbi:MAG: orotidine-5'-phosphate decarboxylase [Actinomycetota bacterium]